MCRVLMARAAHRCGQQHIAAPVAKVRQHVVSRADSRHSHNTVGQEACNIRRVVSLQCNVGPEGSGAGFEVLCRTMALQLYADTDIW